MDKKSIDILFVEDSEEQLAALKSVKEDLIGTCSVEITVAKTYEEYKTKTKSKSFDLVLMPYHIRGRELYADDDDCLSETIIGDRTYRILGKY